MSRIISISIISLSIFIGIVLFIQTRPVSSKQYREATLAVNGKPRYFIPFVPKSYKAGNPAVIVFHGGSLSMRRILDESKNSTGRWVSLAKEEGFLLLIPNGYNSSLKDANGDRQTWNDIRPRIGNNRNLSTEDDVSFTSNLINWAYKHHKIDKSRVFVTGSSNGGMMALKVLVKQPQHFAAGAVFIASLPESYVPYPSEGTPIMIMNGDADPLVKWEGGVVSNGGSPTRPVEDTLKYWLKANKVDNLKPKVKVLPNKNTSDRCIIVQRSYYHKGSDKPSVVFYRNRGGGHLIPDDDPPKRDRRLTRILGNQCMDAHGVELAWEFMKRTSRESK